MSFRYKAFLMLVVLGLFACKGESTAKEYGYVFNESTGQNEYLVVDRKEVPLHFDQRNSNKLAYDSLRSLRARVLYPNSRGNKIFLVGDYDVQSQLFVLGHWHIRTPFTEITLEDRIQMADEIRTIHRTSLERTDFETNRGFNPYSMEFNPKDFQVEEK